VPSERGDSLQAFARLLERARHLPIEVFVVQRALRLLDFAARHAASRDGALQQLAKAQAQRARGLHRFFQEWEIVAHELHRRIDLVGDAGGQAPYRLELLRVTELELEPLALCDILHQQRREARL
jgi:hypothetical protein